MKIEILEDDLNLFKKCNNFNEKDWVIQILKKDNWQDNVCKLDGKLHFIEFNSDGNFYFACF